MIDSKKKGKRAMLVEYDMQEEKGVVSVRQVCMNEDDPSQIMEQATIQTQAHMLASGLSLIIKQCSLADYGIKDYELMEEIINHIEHEFTSTSSFQNSETSIQNINGEIMETGMPLEKPDKKSFWSIFKFWK